MRTTMMMKPTSLPKKEADADGGSGIGQEPAADTHELQWFLESLENRDAVEIDVH